MSEFDQHQMTRLEFLRGVAALTGSLLIPQSFYKESNGAAVSERFSPNPSWVQDFSKMADGQPDPEYWNYVLGNTVPGYNNEAETLTNRPSNIRIQNGLLVIEARVQEDNDRQYTSAEIDTQGKFGFEYGKLEVNLKLPEGIGTWPAAWLLPTKPKYNPLKYGLTVPNGNWRINGEIDFAEAIGAMPGYVYPSVHTSSNFGKTNNDPVHLDIPNDTTAFHTYGVEKLPDSIVFTYDGKPYHTVNKTSDSPVEWPLNQEYYLILNLAMGGSWGGIDKSKFPNTDGIDNSKAPWQYQIRSINFYDLAA